MNRKNSSHMRVTRSARTGLLLTLVLLMLVLANLAGAADEPPVAPDVNAAAADAAATVTTVTTGIDNFMEARNPLTNKGSDPELKVKTKSDDIKRSLVQFDLSSIPFGATIDSATLTLFRKSGGAAMDIDACQVTQEWVDEASTSTAQKVSNWTNRDQSGGTPLPWATAGGTYDSAECVTLNVTDNDNTLFNWNVTSVVDNWFGAGADPNYGFLMKATTAEATIDIEHKFRSFDDGATPPTLAVTWSCGVNTSTIGDFVWEDTNENGIYDGGESGLNGVKVNLLNSTGTTVLATTTTASGGAYQFTCVSDGTYIVEFVEPFGYLLTDQNQGTSPPDVNSKPDPTTGRTAPFSVVAPQAKNDQDAGFIADTNASTTQPNGLFYGDGDNTRYIKLGDSYDQNGLLIGAFYGLLDGGALRMAFVGDGAMNDNVFDDVNASPNPTAYMASVGWGENRPMKKLYDSEKLIDIKVACGGTVLYQWTQSYLCKGSEYVPPVAYPYLGPLLASNGGLQSTLPFFEPIGVESMYEFGSCGRDSGTVPPNYTAATSLAWNLNHTLWEADRTWANTGTPSVDERWKSPTDPLAAPGGPTDTPKAFNYPFFDTVNLWEWPMVYEMSFDISACTQQITITANSIHNSPSKGGDDAFFEEPYYDHGDLPNSYGTLDANSGPYHNPLIIGNAFLGTRPDNEVDGQPTADARGDDNNFNDDEDGVTVIDPFICGTDAKINVNIGSPGYLSGWIDFNNSGNFTASAINVKAITGPGGATLPGTPFTLGDTLFDTVGDYQLTIAVPAAGASCTGDSVAARFRITKTAGEGGNSPTQVVATLPSGEVEDYLFDTGAVPGAIGNYVWLDENSDGFQDEGEPGLANVVVQLKNSNGVVLQSTITDAHGGYLFDKLPEGTYHVDVLESSLPAGMVQTPYNLPGADFGNQDHSGIGYEVILSAGAENLTADFGYNFNSTICVTDPADAACNDPTGVIGDRVWIDADGDGAQDDEEAGIGGVTVCITYDSNGDGFVEPGVDSLYLAAVDQNGASGTGCTTTEPDGSYIFNNLPPGQYIVEVTPPAGYTQTGDPDQFGLPCTTCDNKTTTPVVLGPGDVFLNADFGYQITNTADRGSIGDLVFFDANGDGIFNGLDYGLPGVTIVLAIDSGNPGVIDAGEVVATTTTGANGAYLFPGLPLNKNYLVAVTDTDNVLGELVATIGSSPSANNHSKAQPYAITLNSGNKDDLTADFGYTPDGHDSTRGLIGDFVFLDVNNSNTQDAGDQGLEGVTVRLYDATGTTLIATTTTNELGYYYFGDLPLNLTYTVKVDTTTLPAGLTNNVDPDGGNDSKSVIAITTGSPINLAQDFGYKPTSNPGSIGNLVWEDTNADGIKDAGEVGINGVTLDLYYDTNGNGQVDPGEPKMGSTITAGGGAYLFSNLPTANNGVGAAGSDYIVDVTDVNGVLAGYWHSLGTKGLDNNSQADPYAANISTASPNNLTADFGYYVKPGAVGNFVWADMGAAVGGGIEKDGLFNEPASAGINGVEMTLTITYPDGTVTVLKTVTANQPGTGNPGWYTFGNLLLDENYNGNLTGTDPNEPTYVLSIGTAPSSFQYTTFKGVPDAVGIDQGTDNNADDKGGEPAFPPQGGADNTNDFGFSSTPTAISLLGFGGLGAGSTAVWSVALLGLVLFLSSLALFALTRRRLDAMT